MILSVSVVQCQLLDPGSSAILGFVIAVRKVKSIVLWKSHVTMGALLRVGMLNAFFIPTFFIYLLLQVWRFSTAFSPVLSWHFSDLPSMSDHLKKCQFNIVEHKTEPVPLPAMCTARDGHSLRCVLRHINT